ncbi:MAG: dihydrolipoamide acetyltransferase family protein [Euryarchaeota archaeon]|nr:dihydrolipoamide acetyltransferase family protein [Euryarchaeota archaeon]
MTDTPFTLPDLGESDSGELVTWLVEAGETVSEDQPVAEVETEKSVVEVPAPNAGTVTELLVEEGSTVEVGAEILRLEADESADAESADAEAEPATDSEAEPEPTDQPAEEVTISDERVFAPPRVRRLARELGVDIASVEGSETGGRINEDDVRAAAESTDEAEDGTAGPKPFTPSGKSAVSKDGEAVSSAGITEKSESKAESGPKPFTPSGKSAVSKGGEAVSGAGMADKKAARSAGAVTHAAHYDTAVVAELTDLRAELEPHAEAHGVELTLLPLLIKAVVRTLAERPTLNATVGENGAVTTSDEYHIGLAVGTDDGLVVPVVRNADEKTVLELAAEIGDLLDRAEAGELTAEETGGTFTVTTPGAIGDEYATLPLDAETASLALGAVEPRPVVVDGEVVARETLPLSLSVDPRAVDSTEAAAFVEQVVGYLESPTRLLLTLT